MILVIEGVITELFMHIKRPRSEEEPKTFLQSRRKTSVMNALKKMGLAAVLGLSVLGFSSCEGPLRISGMISFSNPAWAPPYHPGARYYYIPDIEVYYDMSDREFVYLNNGQWMFSPVLPSLYAGYDLYTGFIISLNLGVYQPWMHHQYYVAHYPRYYYNNVYRNEIGNIRGFNENERKPFYWQQGEKDRIKDLRNNPPDRRPEVQRPPQNTNYYGKPVGDPVKVRPQMKNKEKPKEQGVKRPVRSS